MEKYREYQKEGFISVRDAVINEEAWKEVDGTSVKRSVRVFKHALYQVPGFTFFFALDMWTVIKKLFLDRHMAYLLMHMTFSYIFPEIFDGHRAYVDIIE